MPGHKDYDCDFCEANDVDFVLADTDRFDEDNVPTRGIEHGGDVGSGARQSAQRSARGHAADVDSGIGEMILHADAVA